VWSRFLRPPKPEPLQFRYTRFAVVRKSDAKAIALLEARDVKEAACRAAYLVAQLGLGEFSEVDVVATEEVDGGTPTFFDSYFRLGNRLPTRH
jgi:hypothetical protein